MTSTITVGKKLIPLDQIALVEPFDPAAHPGMRTDRAFKARLVLVDRQSVLTEDTPAAFAEAHGFRMIAEDGVATNPLIRSFRVETFEPGGDFNPTKPFRSRLLWKDLSGNTNSKLLLSAPEVILAIAVTGKSDGAAVTDRAQGDGERATASNTGRRKSRRRMASAQPA